VGSRQTWVKKKAHRVPKQRWSTFPKKKHKILGICGKRRTGQDNGTRKKERERINANTRDMTSHGNKAQYIKGGDGGKGNGKGVGRGLEGGKKSSEQQKSLFRRLSAKRRLKKAVCF